MKSRKGQLTLADAPQVVMIVGLVFLVMATIALISSKYGDSFPYTTTNVVNESTFINSSGDYLSGIGTADAKDFTVVRIINGSSGAIIQSANYSLGSSTGLLKNSSTSPIVWANANITYSYRGHSSAAYNVTGNLETEIASNTSIAGIILTISLVGIVLSVLIGVFLAIRRNRV